MNVRNLVTNAVIAALYVVITAVVAPISFGALQFRIAEMFNHLAVFNRKNIAGIVAGVAISNLFFSPMVAYDMIFGVGHSLISLLIMVVLTKNIQNDWVKMSINTVVFTLASALIAWELNLAFELPFWYTYFTVAVGELIVMAAGMPIMALLKRSVNFDNY